MQWGRTRFEGMIAMVRKLQWRDVVNFFVPSGRSAAYPLIEPHTSLRDVMRGFYDNLVLI